MIHDDLSDAVLALAEHNSYDLEHGVGKTLGYYFFSEDTICLPVFELLQRYRRWDWSMVNKTSLMNAVWTKYPEYAVAQNFQEQRGSHDTLGLLLRSLGIDVELQSWEENMIILTPEVGVDFLNFQNGRSEANSYHLDNTERNTAAGS